jgi:hypothetical protein
MTGIVVTFRDKDVGWIWLVAGMVGMIGFVVVEVV